MTVTWDDGDDTIFEIPVAAVVTGIADINTEDGSYRNFSHEYHFFDFETRIVDKMNTFTVILPPHAINLNASF